MNHGLNAERYLSQATRNQVDGARKSGASAAILFREDGVVEAVSLLGKMTGASTHAVAADLVLAGDVTALHSLSEWLHQQRDSASTSHG